MQILTKVTGKGSHSACPLNTLIKINTSAGVLLRNQPMLKITSGRRELSARDQFPTYPDQQAPLPLSYCSNQAACFHKLMSVTRKLLPQYSTTTILTPQYSWLDNTLQVKTTIATTKIRQRLLRQLIKITTKMVMHF